MLEAYIWATLRDKRLGFAWLRNKKFRVLLIYGLLGLVLQADCLVSYLRRSKSDQKSVCKIFDWRNFFEIIYLLGFLPFLLASAYRSDIDKEVYINPMCDLNFYNRNREFDKKT